jgi:uncharacterized YigZ family protein
MFEDTYKTITKTSRGVYKDRGSKFIAIAYPVGNEEDVKMKLTELKKEYHDARHHCYAYQLGFDKSAYRINDDGEPSGTAGKPIYGQILSKDLTNILIVVVRYFGGIKLGVSGLINAYRSAARDALEDNSIITKTINEIFEIRFDYPLMNDVMKILKDEKLRQLTRNFELTCLLTFSVRKSDATRIQDKFRKMHGLDIKHVKTI